VRSWSRDPHAARQPGPIGPLGRPFRRPERGHDRAVRPVQEHSDSTGLSFLIDWSLKFEVGV
jgi:hypothetical protein